MGHIAADWPHVEEAMISVLAELLGGGRGTPAHQIFRSIVNAKARIDVMRNLLEMAEINKNREIYFDEVIDEFKSLNDKRNEYMHNIWMSYNNGDAYLCKASPSVLGYLMDSTRKVPLKELKDVNARMITLIRKIYLEMHEHKNTDIE